MTEEDKNKLREPLAELCHAQWSGWMKYIFAKAKNNHDGTFTIQKEHAERWDRQMFTDYEHLSEEEQNSDRKEADRFLSLLSQLKHHAQIKS